MAYESFPIFSSETCARPEKPSARAPAAERSITLPRVKGPRRLNPRHWEEGHEKAYDSGVSYGSDHRRGWPRSSTGNVF
jgi:hypothetical protein